MTPPPPAARRESGAGPGARRPDLRSAIVFCAALIAYTLVFYRDLLFAQRVTVFRDQYTIILAIDHVVRLLSSFDWPPLWTPFQVLGKPLAADPLSAVFYPPNWALRLLPSPLGYNASVALHHALAATGMYALLRHRRVSALASALGGLLFGFGGLFVAFDNMLNALQSATWTPWTLLAFDRWCARRDLASLAATAAGLALTLLGGMPEACVLENALFVAVTVDRRQSHSGPPLARAAAAVLAADLLALGLAAVQLLPTAEYVLSSSRATGLQTEGVLRLSLSPLGILAFLLPRHYVDPSGAFHETAALWEGDFAGAPWALTLYLGPLLVLAAAAGAALDRRRRWWWAAVGAAFLALSCGAHTPGYRWLVERVALLRAARYPEKFLLVVHGLLIVAAVLGLESALRDPRRFRRIAGAAVGLAALGAVAAAALRLRPGFAHALLGGDLLRAAALCVAIAAVAVLAARGAVRPGTVALTLLALAAADLYRVNGQLLPTVGWDDIRRVPETVRAMTRGDDPLRIYSDGLGLPAVPAFPDGFLQEQNLLLAEVASYYGIANLNAPASINLADHERLEALVESLPRERTAALFAAFNTAYVTSPKDLLRYAGLTLLRAPQSPLDAYLYAVERVAPRAFVAGALQPVAQAEEAIEYLRGADEPARRVAVDAAAIPPGLPAVMAGTVRLDVYRPQEVELAASMQTPGLVVLSDTFYPGWLATVDGAPAPLARANYFARGVFVPAGEHRVVFRYRPASYRVGAWLSAASLVALLAGVLVARRHRR